MVRWRRTTSIAVLVLAGCTGSSDDTSDTAQPDASQTTVTVDEASTTTSAEQPAPAPVEPADDTEQPTDVESDDTSAWISRRSMSASAVEVVWSAPEGADSYELHRVPRSSDQEPEPSVMNDNSLIHTDEARGVFLDSDVIEGTRYWYGVRGVDADGAMLSIGWHKADAVTDETPPEPVNLSISIEDGSVLLSWDPAIENYEMHGYRILRGVDGAEPETVATSWDLDRTSFLDDTPPEGSVTYAVEAFDFHWNDSDHSTVTVDLPG